MTAAAAPEVLIIGSSNTDLVISTERLPTPGETLLGGAFFRAAGGKGANQAVAAARAGAHVTLVARTGRDDFGRDLAYLFLPDGTMLNQHMVESGHALAFLIAPNRRHEARIQGAETSASESRQGLWAVWGFACKPVDFRRGRCSS